MTIASRKIVTVVGVLLVLTAVFSLRVDSARAATQELVTGGAPLEVEVAEDGTRFVFDEAPTYDDGFPDYGNGFVTQGYIYPAGTLDGHDGVNPDGSAEYPAKVLGTWTCYGYFIGEGAYTEDGPWVITTQVFEFDSPVVGGETIVTVGSEMPAGLPAAARAVVGGTGRFASVSGEVRQITMGHNASDGVDAGFEFRLRGVAGQIRQTHTGSSVDGAALRIA